MEFFLNNILYEPVMFCLFIFVKVQKAFLLVHKDLLFRRALDMALVGDLITWLVAALAVVAVVYLVAKFILADAAPQVGGAEEFSAMLSSVLSRLFVVLVLYMVLSVLVYIFFNAGAMVVKEMEYVPPKSTAW